MDSLGDAALSFALSGNTGVSPFLTLFLVGALERANPALLDMGGTMENLLASGPSLCFLGAMSVVEFVAKCIPALDQVVDTAMLFIVPIMSILAGLSAFGTEEDNDANMNMEQDANRSLNVAESTSSFFQVIVIVIGVGLAVSVHMLKMLIRLVGIGWLTNCLTVIETTFCIVAVTLSIYIRQVAIFLACLILVVSIFNLGRVLLDKRQQEKSKKMSQFHDDLEGNYDLSTKEGDMPNGPSDRARPVIIVQGEDVTSAEGHNMMPASIY